MSKPEVVFLIISLFSLIFSKIQGQTTCTGSGVCTCSMSDGSGVIDLTSLGKNDGTAAFPDNYATDGYFYSYNPCNSFNEGSCSGVAGCQVSGDQASQYTIADPTSATFSYDGTNAHVVYSHTDDSGFHRQFDVTLQCDQTADPPTFVANGEASPSSGQYSATLTTKCACPNVCGNAPPPQTTHKPGHNGGSGGGEEGGLTVGSWLCIIFFSVAFLYIVGGILIQKGVRKANGKEVMPNSNFWLALPGYVKDGFQFTFGRICKRSGYESK